MDNLLLTLQEHYLIGSTFAGDKKNFYEKNPYTPIIILENKMTVEECNDERLKLGYIENVFGLYWGLKYLEYKMTLEGLIINPNDKKYGHTVADPAIIKAEDPYDIKDMNKSFPFIRSKNPRVELKND